MKIFFCQCAPTRRSVRTAFPSISWRKSRTGRTLFAGSGSAAPRSRISPVSCSDPSSCCLLGPLGVKTKPQQSHFTRLLPAKNNKTLQTQHPRCKHTIQHRQSTLQRVISTRLRPALVMPSLAPYRNGNIQIHVD